MSEDELDPGASTEMFQAFVDRAEPEASRSSWAGVAVAGVVLAGLLIVVALVWLVLAN